MFTVGIIFCLRGNGYFRYTFHILTSMETVYIEAGATEGRQVLQRCPGFSKIFLLL